MKEEDSVEREGSGGSSGEASGPPPEEGGPATSTFSCFSCRISKRYCDKTGPPCGRCVKLGLECVMQTRGRGRPSKRSKQLEQQQQPLPPPRAGLGQPYAMVWPSSLESGPQGEAPLRMGSLPSCSPVARPGESALPLMVSGGGPPSLPSSASPLTSGLHWPPNAARLTRPLSMALDGPVGSNGGQMSVLMGPMGVGIKPETAEAGGGAAQALGPPSSVRGPGREGAGQAPTSAALSSAPSWPVPAVASLSSFPAPSSSQHPAPPPPFRAVSPSSFMAHGEQQQRTSGVAPWMTRTAAVIDTKLPLSPLLRDGRAVPPGGALHVSASSGSNRRTITTTTITTTVDETASSHYSSSSSSSLHQPSVEVIERPLLGADDLHLAYDSWCRGLANLRLDNDLDLSKVDFVWRCLEFLFLPTLSPSDSFAGPQLLQLFRDISLANQPGNSPSARQQQLQITNGRPLTLLPPLSAQEALVASSSSSSSSSSVPYAPPLPPVGGVQTTDTAAQGVVWVDELFNTQGAATIRCWIGRPVARVEEKVRANDLMASMFMSAEELLEAARQLRTIFPPILARLMSRESISIFFQAFASLYGVRKGTTGEVNNVLDMRTRRGEQLRCFCTIRYCWMPGRVVVGTRFLPATPIAFPAARLVGPLSNPHHVGTLATNDASTSCLYTNLLPSQPWPPQAPFQPSPTQRHVSGSVPSMPNSRTALAGPPMPPAYSSVLLRPPSRCPPASSSFDFEGGCSSSILAFPGSDGSSSRASATMLGAASRQQASVGEGGPQGGDVDPLDDDGVDWLGGQGGEAEDDIMVALAMFANEGSQDHTSSNHNNSTRVGQR